MNTPHPELEPLGWSKWFEERAGSEPAGLFARVAAVDRDLLLLVDPTGPFRATLSGRLLHERRLATELPCVGDWVRLEKTADGFGVVHAVLERRTSLRRRAAGSAADTQMIAANVDCVVVVQSCHFDFNVRRLERYLVMVADGGAEPCILLTKTDLVSADAVAQQIAAIRAAAIEAPVVTLSNVTSEGLAELRQLLLPGKTFCFVGSSGVGKSTLINHLVGRERQDTRNVSGTGEGQHTTVRRELIQLEGGALVIDNPGMREFGVACAENSLGGGFADIASLASGCRFRDCTHTTEPGCAVLAALRTGEVSEEHFASYRKLRGEAAFREMSQLERRRKDRAFGRFVRSVKKDLRD